MARRIISRFSTSRQTFGSFHSDDAEILVRNPSKVVLPKFYANARSSSIDLVSCDISKDFQYGKEAMGLLFDLDSSWNFINHGAFGATLRPLLVESFEWRRYAETQPLRFFDRELFQLASNSILLMSSRIRCNPTALVPVQNVTSGMNSVFNSVFLAPNDEVLCFSTTYGSTKKLLKDYSQRFNAKIVTIEIPLPIKSKESIITEFRNKLTTKTKVIVLDHITSNTAFEFPIWEIGKMCKDAGILVIVDAAHSLFTQDIIIDRIYLTKTTTSSSSIISSETASSSSSLLTNNNQNNINSISDIADIWITNAHKWLCAPKGSGFMWIAPHMMGKIRPNLISHGYQPNNNENNVINIEQQSQSHSQSQLQSSIYAQSQSLSNSSSNSSSNNIYAHKDRVLSSFIWDGCRDYSSLITTPRAFEIFDLIPNTQSIPSHLKGIDSCRYYMRQLIIQATELLLKEWNILEDEMPICNELRSNVPMALIPLPKIVRGINTRENMTDNEAYTLQEILHHVYNIEVPIKCLEGKLYVRISAHIYNYLEQYQQLAHVMRNL